MKSNSIIKVLTAVLFSVVMGGILAPVLGISTLAAAGGLTAASFIPKPQGVMSMALDVEIWKPWIVEQLFRNNEFLNYAVNADEYVLQGKVVHIPNAGDASSVTRNRTSLPATVKKRTDIDITYALDEFTSDPRILTDAEKILSYDKMTSMMGQDMRAIRQLVADWVLYHWRVESADYIVRTSGAAVAAHLSGATGNRKAIKPTDLEEAAARMDEVDIPSEGRYALLDARINQQFMGALSPTEYRDFSSVKDMKKNIVGEYAGFKIIKRSSVLRATNAGTPVVKAPGAAAATSDNAVALCWQQDCVERALGETKIFENQQDPQYYGDIYSLLVRMGGRKIRNDQKGVVGIIQAAS